MTRYSKVTADDTSFVMIHDSIDLGNLDDTVKLTDLGEFARKYLDQAFTQIIAPPKK